MHNASDYFTYFNNNKQNKCDVCGQCLKGYVLRNMRNHLKAKHKEIYALIEPPKLRRNVVNPYENVRLSLLQMCTLNGRH